MFNLVVLPPLQVPEADGTVPCLHSVSEDGGRCSAPEGTLLDVTCQFCILYVRVWLARCVSRLVCYLEQLVMLAKAVA